MTWGRGGANARTKIYGEEARQVISSSHGQPKLTSRERIRLIISSVRAGT